MRCICGCRSSARFDSDWRRRSITTGTAPSILRRAASRRRPCRITAARSTSISTSSITGWSLRQVTARAADFALQAGSVAEFYARFMSELKRLGLVVHIYDKPNELPVAIPFPDDAAPRPYDARRGQSFLARAFAGRSRVEGVSLALHRKMQPGARVLGRDGSRGHAILRPHRAGASGRHPAPARSCDARILLSRGEQLRLLERHGADRLSRVSMPTRIRSRRVSPRRASRRKVRSTAPISASSSCPTSASASPRRPTTRCSGFCSRPTRRPRTWRAGIVRRSSGGRSLSLPVSTCRGAQHIDQLPQRPERHGI